MSLDKTQLDLFFAFTARHKRFLKTRETSFTPKQLEYGVAISEKAVKTVQAACKTLGLLPKDAVLQQANRAKLTRELRKKVSKLSPKQAAYIIEHFEAFHLAVEQAQSITVVKNPKKPAEYGDRYYQPTQHKYR